MTPHEACSHEACSLEAPCDQELEDFVPGKTDIVPWLAGHDGFTQTTMAAIDDVNV